MEIKGVKKLNLSSITTSIFQQAERLVNTDRAADYGSPTQMCSHIAAMWNAYLKLDEKPITAEQVAYMMVLFKIARQSYKDKDDNLTDMLGYVGVADKVRKGE